MLVKQKSIARYKAMLYSYLSINLDCFVAIAPRNDIDRLILSLRAKRSNLKKVNSCTMNLAVCGGTFFDRINMINKIFLYFLYPEHPVYPV